MIKIYSELVLGAFFILCNYQSLFAIKNTDAKTVCIRNAKSTYTRIAFAKSTCARGVGIVDHPSIYL